MEKTKVLKLDLSKIRSLTSLKDVVLQTLRERDLYKPNLLYRGFDSRFVEHVLTWGSENNEQGMYALPESYLSIDPDPRWYNPLHYAWVAGSLAIYDGDKLKLGYNCIDWYYFIDQTRKNEVVTAVFSSGMANQIPCAVLCPK